MNRTVCVCTRSGNTDVAFIGGGALQGCLVSPLLFSNYTEATINEALEELQEGMTVGGHLVK